MQVALQTAVYSLPVASATPEGSVLSGVAFLLLGGAAFLAPPGQGRSIAWHLPWLGAFGLTHGIRELLEASRIVQSSAAPGMREVAALLAVASFAALFEFARRAVADQALPTAGTPIWSARMSTRLSAPWIPGVLLLAIGGVAVASDQSTTVGVNAARLVLCLPGGVVGGVMLWRAGDLDRGARRTLGAALLGYGLLGAIPGTAAAAGVRPLLQADDWFTARVGVPVELLLISLALIAASAVVVVVRRRASAMLTMAQGEVAVARRALEAAQHAIAVSGVDGRLEYVNPAFVALWRLRSASDATGRSATEFWSWPEAAAEVMRALHETGSWAGTLEARIADGTVKPVSVSGSLLRDTAGAATGLLGSFIDVSEQEELQRRSKGHEEFSRSLLDALPAVVVVLAFDGRIETANPYFESLAGWEPGELAGRDWFDTCLPLRDRERIRAVFSRSAGGDPTRGYVNPIITRDGRERAIEWSDTLLRDAEGSPRAILAVGVDVTDRLEAVRSREVSEARLRAIVDAEPECVKVVDEAGCLVEMNPAGLRMIEAGALDEVIGRPMCDLLGAEHRAQFAAATAAVFRGESVVSEFEIVGLRGAPRWVEQNAVPLLDPADPMRVTGMLAVSRDVTHQRASERRLRESEARLREAQAIGRLGSWELDLTTQHLVWSDEIFEIFGIDPAHFGASYEAFLGAIHPDDRDAVNEAYTRAVEERREYQIVHRLLLPDGRVKWVEERARTWYAEDDGAPLRSAGTVQDITERVQAERRLRRSLAEKEMLLREIHHRVKNNLQIIASLLYFQSKKVKAAEDVPIFLEGRDRLRAMILVHETLYQEQDLSHIAFGGYVRKLVGQLSQSFGAAERGVRFEVVESGDPRLPIDLAVPCGMLLTELVVNAFKYAFPGGAAGQLRVELALNGETLEMTVADDGVGLPAGFDVTTSASFGWQLIQALVGQLNGTVMILEGAGTAVRVACALPSNTADRLASMKDEGAA